MKWPDHLAHLAKQAILDRGIGPDEVCQRCGAYPNTHECCHCLGAGRVRVVEDREHPDFGKSYPCPECSSQQRPQALDEFSFNALARIPQRYQEARLDTWRESSYSGSGRPLSGLRQWCSSFPPAQPFVLMYGAVGNGKTHLGVGLLRAANAGFGLRGALWHELDIVQRYRASNNPDRATETEADVDNYFTRVPLLMIDDLGVSRQTDYVGEKLYWLINTRYVNESPTIITTNVEVKEERIFSRLIDSQSTLAIRFDGRDYRQKG